MSNSILSKYSKVCKNVVTSDGLESNDVKRIVYSSPVANLIQSVNEMNDFYNKELDTYDPIATGMIATSEIFDSAAEQSTGSLPLPDVTVQEVKLSDESANLFCSGFIQSMQNNESNQLAITDKDGLVYVVQAPNYDGLSDDVSLLPLVQITDSGAIPLLTHKNDGWYLNTIMVATNYVSSQGTTANIQGSLINLYWVLYLQNDFVGKTVLWLSQQICLELTGSSYSTIAENVEYSLSEIFPNEVFTNVGHALSLLLNHFKSLKERRAPIAYVMDSMVDAAETTSAYQRVCDCLLSAHPKDSLNSLRSSVSEKKAVTRHVVNTVCDGYTTGGFRGAVQVLIAYFKGGSSMQQEDGSLSFTDNSGLLPKEFIAGAIASLLSAVASIVGLIVSIFNLVIGAILTIIGGLLYGVIKSVTGVVNDTYSSVNSQFSEDVQVLPLHPVAFMQGQANVNTHLGKFLLRSYYKTLNCGYMFVPGGALIFGPGDFNDQGAITSMRWEFHPYSGVYDMDIAGRRVYNSRIAAQFADLRTPTAEKLAVFSKGQVRAAWKQFQDDLLDDDQTYCKYLVLSNEQDTGHLSADNDVAVRRSLSMNIGWFALWLTADVLSLGQIESLHLDPNKLHCVKLLVYDDDDHDEINRTMNDCMARACGYYEVDARSWTQIVELCVAVSQNAMADGGEIRVGVDVCDHAIDYIERDDASYCVYKDTMDLQFMAGNGWFQHDLATSKACVLPSEFYYDMNVPQYNGATFWLWAALATVLTATVAVAAVVVSFKVKNAMNKKKAANKQRFDAAQQEYNNALNGEIHTTKYNEETGKWEDDIQVVDPNSTEGKALINSTWKNYKKTARNNNLWQKVIGGSRYDVGSFWGEADDSGEDISFSEKLSSVAESEDADQVQAASQLAIQDQVTSETTGIRNKMLEDTNSILSQVTNSSDATVSAIQQSMSTVATASVRDIVAAVGDSATVLQSALTAIRTLITGVTALKVITPEK